MPLYVVFIDFTKTFDTVPREALWVELRKYGCTEKIINLIKSFHDGMQALTSYGNDASRKFDVTNGVKQGCVLAPLLFCIVPCSDAWSSFRWDSGRNLHTNEAQRRSIQSIPIQSSYSHFAESSAGNAICWRQCISDTYLGKDATPCWPVRQSCCPIRSQDQHKKDRMYVPETMKCTRNMKARNIEPRSWQQTAEDRPTWRSRIKAPNETVIVAHDWLQMIFTNMNMAPCNCMGLFTNI